MSDQMTEELFTILNDDTTRQVFSEIVKNRSIMLKDLRESVATTSTNSTVNLQESLNQLKGAHLIEETDAPVEDFKRVFVTKDGLYAERQLRRMPSLNKSAAAAEP